MTKKKTTKQEGRKKKIPGGGAWLLTVKHDWWCGIFEGRACDCNPEVGKPERINKSWPEDG